MEIDKRILRERCKVRLEEQWIGEDGVERILVSCSWWDMVIGLEDYVEREDIYNYINLKISDGIKTKERRREIAGDRRQLWQLKFLGKTWF